MSRSNSSQENLRQKESKLASMAVADENALQASFNVESKAHQKQDDMIRHEYVTQLHNMHIVDDQQHEKDNHMKKVHYGEYLLKQMDEKENRKLKVSHSPVNTTAFCEAFIDPTEKNRLKMMKQKEFKAGLDACVREKHDIKMELQRKELVEDEKRNEFLQKQEHDSHDFSEKNKQRFERKEQHKNDVAMMWRSENNHKMADTDKLMDSTVDNCNFEEELEGNVELLEIHRRLQARKALLGQMEDRIEASYRKFEEEKMEREELLLEVRKEEERLKQLKEEEKHKQSDYNQSLQSMIQENAEKKRLDKIAQIEEDKKLLEIQKLGDEEVDRMKHSMMANGHNHHHHTFNSVKEDDQSLHSRFY